MTSRATIPLRQAARRAAPILLVLLVLVAPRAAAVAAAPWRLVEEHWYVLELGGARGGWTSQRVHADGGRYRTSSETHLKMSRGDVEVSVSISGTFVETADGEPLVLTSTESMGRQPVSREWRFDGDEVVETVRQGGREQVRRRAPPEGKWLTPMAVQRLWRKRLETEAGEIAYRTLLPESGLQLVELRHVRLGEDAYEHGGRELAVTVWESTSSLQPGLESVEKYDAEGTLVHGEATIPMLGRVVTRLATKAEAQREAEAPELLVSTFVTPDRPIPRAGRAVASVLRLRVAEGEMPALPSAGAQRVEPGPDPAAAVLRVDLRDNVEADPGEAADRAYLGASAMVDPNDPLVGKLADRALRGVGDDPYERAEALRASVHELISAKGLDTAFATSAETARTRSGDCSEHAVLLAALLRSEGIPARVAVGLVYADSFLGRDHIFGWHMWTQALIDGRWVDFDATLPRRYHAAHVLTATSALEEGALTTELASTLLLMGNLEIDVVDVEYE